MDTNAKKGLGPGKGGGLSGQASGEQDFYYDLFNRLPDAVFVEDQQGRIHDCNDAALKIFGYTREEMLELSLKDLVPLESAGSIPDFIDEVNTTGGIFVWISSRKKDGTVFPAQYSSHVLGPAGDTQVLVIIRDLSDQYIYRHPVSRQRTPGLTPAARDFANLTMTWEVRGKSIVLIGFDNRAMDSTRQLIGDFTGKTAREIYSERQDIVSDLEQCFMDRSILRRKTIYKMFTTGEERITEITYMFVHPNLVVMHLEDCTEHDTAEALNKSIVKSSPVGLCLIQSDKLKFANPKLQEYTGYTESELFGIRPAKLIHPRDRYRIARLLGQNRIAETPSAPVEFRMITKKGDIRWMMITFTTIFYLHEQGLLLNVVDITELKLARKKLDELTKLQSSIMASIPHAVIGIDNRRIVFTNHAVETVFGWKPDEIIGKTMQIFLKDRKEYIREARKLYEDFKEKQTVSREYTYKRKDGSDVICLSSASRMSERKDDRRIVATLTDITEKKRAEESLKENQRVLATLMGNLPGMAYRCKNDFEWTMDFVSEGSHALTGFRPADLIGSARISYGDLIHPDDRQKVWDAVQESLSTRERFEIMYRIITITGSVKWVWEKGLGIFSPTGKLIAVEGFISDVTERKLAEEQIKRSRKQLRIHAEHLHTVLEGERTEIAREIHDELGQILTALKMDLFWVDRKITDERAEIHDKIQSMIAHIDSTIKTVERILLELRPGLLDDLGLTAAIEWQAEEFQRRTGIVCDAILDPDPEGLISDKKISTAIFRICQEALTNITRHAKAEHAEINLRIMDSYVELMVRDDGKGLTRNDIRKTGSFGILGIKERTRLLGGKVTIAGKRGKGSAVRVRIPL